MISNLESKLDYIYNVNTIIYYLFKYKWISTLSLKPEYISQICQAAHI